MSNVWILIGIPFSGKTRWRTKFVEDNPDACIICPDDIRKELTGDINNQGISGKAFKLFYERLDVALASGVADIVLDGTNINPKTRNEIFSRGIDGTKFHYVIFMCDLRVALARKKADADRITNGERSNVPDDVICRMYDNYLANRLDIDNDIRASHKVIF